MPSVIVTCDGVARAVFIDNQNQGVTDTPLSVREGLHVFDLGLPANYLPPFQELFIEDDPAGRVVPFTLMAAVFARARERRAAARKRVSADKRARATAARERRMTAVRAGATARSRGRKRTSGKPRASRKKR
jgi:hypothetical protein